MRHMVDNIIQHCSVEGPQGSGADPNGMGTGKVEETLCLFPITSTGPEQLCVLLVCPFTKAAHSGCILCTAIAGQEPEAD